MNCGFSEMPRLMSIYYKLFFIYYIYYKLLFIYYKSFIIYYKLLYNWCHRRWTVVWVRCHGWQVFITNYFLFITFITNYSLFITLIINITHGIVSELWFQWDATTDEYNSLWELREDSCHVDVVRFKLQSPALTTYLLHQPDITYIHTYIIIIIIIIIVIIIIEIIKIHCIA